MITGIDTAAPVAVRRDIVVDATLQGVWGVHTDINARTTWQTDISAATIDRPVQPAPYSTGALSDWISTRRATRWTPRMASCGAAPPTALPPTT
ncbi:hypothetical protein ACQP1G_15220 [Nocardia sp. CA-107356]|uniref:hypothetical protein n=1 Tax=Nocardia sp. CA-107356 TaxID=3239972 RepID=UPI003D8DFA50